MDENADGGVVTSVATENATSVTVDDDRFEVADGNLKLAAGTMLDFESDTSPIEVTITASGDGDSATHTVSVSINDVNEDPSVTITPGATVPNEEMTVSSSTVAENAMGSSVPPLALIEITDPDAADTTTGQDAADMVTLSGEHADYFEVKLDPEDGLWVALKADASLDHEGSGGTITVTVTYTDTAGNSASADLEVTVTDANDDPMFAQDAYAFDLNENADGSTTAVSLGMVEASDEDSADTHTFSITAGNDAELFAIDSASGEISYVGTGEDFRSSVTGPSHTLTVEVSDGTSSDEATVDITILNVNEAPTFGDSSYAFDLAENADGSATAVDVGMVSASDSDEGDSVTYSITAGNDAELFAIDSASGAITYVGGGEDAETTASHSLTVSASDGVASSEAMVTVNVTNANDSAPMFGEDSYAFDLAENADGSATAVEVGMVSATDSDGDTLVYSITGGNGDSLFAIDSASGAITYVGGGENYESDTMSHELMVEASDGANSDSATVTVSVTDMNDAPMADAEMAIAPFALVNGAERSMEVNLGALFSDEDGDTLTYTLSSDQDWLSLAVTTEGDDSVTGRVHGTPPDDGNNIEAMVTIVATDADGATGEATFYVVVDAENAAPSSVKLRQTDDGVTSVVTAVEVAENAKGASFGMVAVEDVDSEMHPHGQHKFTFKVDGKADDRFEVVDGMLKLKEDQALSFEDFTDGEFELEVTATDMYVKAPGEDEEDTRGSKSLTIDVTIKDTADGPVAGKIGDWWVTVDDRLDAEDAREGEWLSFVLQTTGEDAAFTDEDSDTLSYSVAVADASGNAVDWLQIDANTGAMTNKEGMVPEAGVYTVTVTATDEDDHSASASFKLAVAVGDLDNSDNDRPDIRDVVDYDYTEGSGGGRVASFEVRDDDIAIAPHPYGTLEVDFTATQDGANVKNRFKLVELGDDGDDTARYEIHHKSADELAKDDKGMALKTPIEPIDYEDGDEVEFTVTVKDGVREGPDQFGEEDDQTIRVDIEDAADSAPVFSQTSITGAERKLNADTKDDTKDGITTLTVDQQGKDVVVVQLSEVWSDDDTDVDELDYSVGGKGDLPDWIKVYGPDDWEDIYERREDVARGDGPSGLRDRDLAIAIVIDHGASEGDHRKPGEALGSFTLTARDPEGNARTETINIDVKDVNVDIPTTSEDKVVMITGDPDGTGSLEMVFDQDLDPDFAAGGEPVLVLYTWTGIAAGPDGELGTADDEETVISVSTSPQPLPLLVDADNDGIADVTGGNVTRDYAGETIKATVQYYEMNPDGTISMVEHSAMEGVAADTTATPAAVPVVSTTATTVSFHITTSATGFSAVIGATGEAAEATATVRLEVSTNGTSGWITEVGAATADTSTGVTTAAIPLNVDENADGTDGDGGGLYYRAVYTYMDANGNPVEEESEVIQLGNVTATTGNGDPTTGNATLGTATAVGGTIRADTQGNPAEVQWQMGEDGPDADTTIGENEWTDIEGATGVSLIVTNDYVGKSLRAKVTYTAEDNAATPGVDETGWVRWIETTAPLTGPAAAANSAPARTQTGHEIRVNITQTTDAMGVKTSVDGSASDDSVAGMFFDSDDDTLTYTLVSAANLQPGNTVYREVFDRDSDSATDEGYQILAIDGETGHITYYTTNVTQHGGNTADGEGNTLVVNVNANDGKTATPDSDPDLVVTVRVNVSPTAINDDGTDTALAATEATAVALATPFSIAETAGVTAAQATSIGAIVQLDVQDLNLVTDDFGTHDVTIMSKQANGKYATDSRFEVTPTGGGRADTDNNGSTWDVRVKEGAKFDFESPNNAGGTVTIKVTATDGGGHSVDAYFTIAITDVGGTGGNKATEDPHYRATPDVEEKEEEEPETPGLKDDSDDSDQDGAVPPDEDQSQAPGDGGMFIDDLIGDDLLGDYVLAIDDMDIA